jgi:quercetin dioxygenase-like cupin family protein
MRKLRRPLAAAAAVAFIGASTIYVIPALATPGSGFAPVTISSGNFAALNVNAEKTGKGQAMWDLTLRTKDRTTVGVDKLVVQPGGFSGWHTHAGPTLVTVTSGEIVWQDGVACTNTTYRAGDTFVEPANHPHNVHSTGAAAEFIAVQMRPVGTAPRIDAPQPQNCS